MDGQKCNPCPPSALLAYGFQEAGAAAPAWGPSAGLREDALNRRMVAVKQLGDLLLRLTFCQRAHIWAFWLSV